MTEYSGLTSHPNRRKLELYDLSVDLGETKDIAAEHPKVVAAIEEYLATARTESKEFPRATNGGG